uniref:HECT domain-containing protein n=1 Tax=Sphaeramia orbicularis TaxID=375764 RepID=A0A672YID7_9TELE
SLPIVSESTTLEDLEKSKAPLLDYLANAGCLRPMWSVGDRDLLVHDTVMFQIIYRVQCPFQRYSPHLVGRSYRPGFSVPASVVPPIGFSPSPSIQFIHKGDDNFSCTPMFPVANTCVNCIKLPLHVSYLLFKEKFDFATIRIEPSAH